MILLLWSTARSWCAASIPRSASETTSSGALISFFMGAPSSDLGWWSAGACGGCGEAALGVSEVDARSRRVCGGTADEAVRRDPETDVAGLLPEHADDGGSAEDRTADLSGEVGGDLRPRELARDGEAESHSRIDVVAADMPEGVDGRDNDGAEGER